MTRLVQSVSAVCDEMGRRQFGTQLLEGYISVLETVTPCRGRPKPEYVRIFVKGFERASC